MQESRPIASVLLALAGPAAAGAAAGLPLGSRHMIVHAAALPGIVVGVTVFMLPALYIATTLAGVSPPAARVGHAALAGLRSTGILLLGLSPALLFLLTTTSAGLLSLLLIGVVFAGSALVGMRALYSRLFDDSVSRARSIPVFVGWSLVCLGLATHLMCEQTARPYVKRAMKPDCCAQLDTLPGRLS